jgi:peptide/nickel transport system permease protein
VGRDILSRIIWGSRTSVTVGFGIVAISMLSGTAIGAFSGLAGGGIDTAIMRVMDVLLSFPAFVMAMALAAALGPDLTNAMLAIAVVRIPFYVRLARGQALSLRERPYVKAAETFGASRIHIVIRHSIPNAMAPIIVQSTLDMRRRHPDRLGPQLHRPRRPGADGRMGRHGGERARFLLDQWWYLTFPGLAIW